MHVTAVRGSCLHSFAVVSLLLQVGANLETVRFLFDGEYLRPDQTPADVGMEDEDVIDAIKQQDLSPQANSDDEDDCC